MARKTVAQKDWMNFGEQVPEDGAVVMRNITLDQDGFHAEVVEFMPLDIPGKRDFWLHSGEVNVDRDEIAGVWKATGFRFDDEGYLIEYDGDGAEISGPHGDSEEAVLKYAYAFYDREGVTDLDDKILVQEDPDGSFALSRLYPLHGRGLENEIYPAGTSPWEIARVEIKDFDYAPDLDVESPEPI